MVTIICEKTGIEFEAPNRRRKCHPVVQGWFATAYNDAVYGNHARYIDKQTFENIEQFVAYFQKLQQEGLQEVKRREEEADAQRKRDKEAQEARRQRHITNDLLRGRGYKWSDLGFKDEEDADFTNFNEVSYGHDWQLFSPDNRAVTVRQAMNELASQDVHFAKKWLEGHPVKEQA